MDDKIVLNKFSTNKLKKQYSFIIIQKNSITIKLYIFGLAMTMSEYQDRYNITNDKKGLDELSNFFTFFCESHNIKNNYEYIYQYYGIKSTDKSYIIFNFGYNLIYQNYYICKKWHIVRLLLIAYQKENIDTCPLALLPLDMIKVICSYFTNYDFIYFRKMVTLTT